MPANPLPAKLAELDRAISRNVDCVAPGFFSRKVKQMEDSRYAGAMPDSMFRTLDAKEEREFRQWAHDHYSLTLPAGFAMFHPVIRDEWRKIETWTHVES